MKKSFSPISRNLRNKDVMRLAFPDSPVFISLHDDTYVCTLECVHGHIVLIDKSSDCIISEVKRLYASHPLFTDEMVSNLTFIFI